MTGARRNPSNPEAPHGASGASDLAGVTELATMLGLTRTAIYSYIERDDLGFPQPEVALHRRRLWSRTAVAEWAARTLPLPEGRPAQKEVWR
jgi:predicted DNA-binding transcriptional regulator AlpA